MTLNDYKKRAAEFRQHMEQPMQPFNPSSVMGAREPAFLPGGEKRSMKPMPPPTSGEDLSHMNPKFSKKFSLLARRGQKRRMKK